jgi:hypothetical protein
MKFELWIDGGWKKHPKGKWLKVHRINPEKNLAFRTPKGQKFIVVIQRNVSSYLETW